MKEADPLDFLLQRHMRNTVARQLVRQPWLVVFDSFRDQCENGGFYCALLDNEYVSRSLESPSWDLHVGGGLPGYSVRYDGGKELAEYHRFGGLEGVRKATLEPVYAA